MRFPALKSSTQAISLRLPVSLLETIKVEAHRRDVPYQSLIKVWLAEKPSRPCPRSKIEEHADKGGRAGAFISEAQQP